MPISKNAANAAPVISRLMPIATPGPVPSYGPNQDLPDYQISRIERTLPAKGSNPDNPQILKILIQTIPVGNDFSTVLHYIYADGSACGSVLYRFIATLIPSASRHSTASAARSMDAFTAGCSSSENRPST